MGFLTTLPGVNPFRTIDAVLIKQAGDALGELEFPARVGRAGEIIFYVRERRQVEQRLQIFHEPPGEGFRLNQAGAGSADSDFFHQPEKKGARKRQFQIGGDAVLAGEFELEPLRQPLRRHDDLFRRNGELNGGRSVSCASRSARFSSRLLL